MAAALGVSRGTVARAELAQSKRASADYRMRHGAAVGLRGSFKFYPAGGAVRDVAQLKYIALFLARIGASWLTKLDVPLPIAGDLRAVDILLASASCRIAVEVVTRLRDIQATVRSGQQKQRDIRADRLIIVLAGSHANRRAVADARPTLLAAFDLDTRRVLAALAAGRDPGRDAIIFLD